MKELYMNIKESRWTMRILPLFIIFLMVSLFAVLTGGRFVRMANIRVLINQTLIVATVSTGAVFIYGTGNVNLSMGACTAVAATVGAMAYLATGSLPIMFAVSLGIGILVMFLSSLLSVLLNVKVLFVTIVMMTLLSAIQEVLLGGSTISIPFDVVNGLSERNVDYLIFVLFFGVSIILFHFTRIGRTIRFIGTNRECAHQTGLSFKKYMVIAFIIAGVGVGAGGILTIIRSGTITSSTAASLNMDCMLAIVLGGMPIQGGSKSKVYAGALGGLMVCILNSGLLMIGVTTTILQGVRGLVFIGIVMLTIKRTEMLPKKEE